MGTTPAVRLARVIADIEALEDALAAVNAADEAAQILALRATRDEDLDEAELIRRKLAVVWRLLAQERQRYYSQRPGPPAEA